MTITITRNSSFHFVRHGVTEQNFRGLRCGGDLDVPLTDVGCDQAYLLAKQLAKMGITPGLILCGSLMRARQTALIMSGVLGGVEMQVNALLDERRLGQWNNQPIADPEPALKRGETPPGGESEAEFSARVARGLQDIVPLLARTPLLVSSKGVGRILNTILGGEGRLQVSNGEVVEFHLAPGTGSAPVLDLRRPHQV